MAEQGTPVEVSYTIATWGSGMPQESLSISMWNDQRDIEGTLGELGGSSSGTPQDPWEFSQIFGQYANPK